MNEYSAIMAEIAATSMEVSRPPLSPPAKKLSWLFSSVRITDASPFCARTASQLQTLRQTPSKSAKVCPAASRSPVKTF